MNSFWCIGDLHGKHQEYLKLTEKYPYTCQIGDFGFSYGILNHVNPTKHKIFCGNHDNVNKSLEWPHFLGDSGPYNLNGVDFFFIRGADSIDKQYRVPGVSWWANEELNYSQSIKCIDQYLEAKPDIVLAHDFPNHIIPKLFNPNPRFAPSHTQKLLEELINIHKPCIYVGGHWHCSRDEVIDGTRFICLNELEVKEILPQGN